MRQYELPPMDCLRMEVSLESRQGTQALSRPLPLPPSASTVITCRRVNSDLLMSMLSLACLPSVPVKPIRSDPARSTNSILLARTLLGSNGSQLSMRMLRMEWLREDWRLRRCAALILFLSPARKCSMRSSGDWHSQTNRFSTVNCSSLLHRSRSPCCPARAFPAALRRSQTRSLQICRKDSDTTKERPLHAAICSKRRRKSSGMMPCAWPSSNSSPCIVQVLPEPVCPQAKTVAWQPLSAFSMRWSISQAAQSSACEVVSSKMQSKLNLRWFCPSATSTSPRALLARMQLFTQPLCASLFRKGRIRMPALILLLLILQFYQECFARAFPEPKWRRGGVGLEGEGAELVWLRCMVAVGGGGSLVIKVMYCGCEGKRRARVQRRNESLDSPFQVRLIKMLGLHSLILDKFVFRRKKSTYDIANLRGSNVLYLDGTRYHPPDYYRTEVCILEKEGHSVPVVRLYPIKLEEGQRFPCIIYAHGNSSDLGDSLRFVTAMTSKFKAEYVAFDFTGYGESRVDSVGEQVICGDLMMVLAWLGRPLEEVVLWGFSLGSYPVTVGAARLPVKAAILQCPIGSLSCMFYDEYERDIKFKEDHFANIDHIAAVKGRVMIMHSLADEIIPVEQARLLYNKYTAANGDKLIEFIEVEKIKHNAFHKYLVALNSNELQKEVVGFLQINQQEIERAAKEAMAAERIPEPHPLMVELRKSITTAELPDEFDEEDFQLEETEDKGRSTGRPATPEGWLCYRK